MVVGSTKQALFVDGVELFEPADSLKTFAIVVHILPIDAVSVLVHVMVGIHFYIGKKVIDINLSIIHPGLVVNVFQVDVDGDQSLRSGVIKSACDQGGDFIRSGQPSELFGGDGGVVAKDSKLLDRILRRRELALSFPIIPLVHVGGGAQCNVSMGRKSSPSVSREAAADTPTSPAAERHPSEGSSWPCKTWAAT